MGWRTITPVELGTWQPTARAGPSHSPRSPALSEVSPLVTRLVTTSDVITTFSLTLTPSSHMAMAITLLRELPHTATEQSWLTMQIIITIGPTITLTLPSFC